MGEINYAAIDIGSNAVRLLIKSVEDGDFKKQIMVRVPLRLGFDVFSEGEISKKKYDKLKRLMKVFNHLMKIYEVKAYRACATSAMRDAANGPSIIEEIEATTKIKVEVIDGQEEAKIIYNSHIDSLEDRDGNYMYVDVGGGSTEINLISGGELIYSKSYNIGTIRILGDAIEQAAWSDFKSDLKSITQGMGRVNIIGSGGNINKLYRLSEHGEDGEQRLTIASLSRLYEELKPLSTKQRRQKYDLKKDRSDVIVPAAEIFLNIGETIGSKYIYVPFIGLTDGIIESLYQADL